MNSEEFIQTCSSMGYSSKKLAKFDENYNLVRNTNYSTNIYSLYKRVMKRDPRAIDEIESLEEAKEIIGMMLGNHYMHNTAYEMLKIFGGKQR